MNRCDRTLKKKKEDYKIYFNVKGESKFSDYELVYSLSCVNNNNLTHKYQSEKRVFHHHLLQKPENLQQIVLMSVLNYIGSKIR